MKPESFAASMDELLVQAQRHRAAWEALAAELERREQALAEKSAALAAAAEQLSQSSAVQAAFKQGREHERARILALIQLQREQLRRGGLNAVLLETLQRTIEGLPQA